MYPCFEHQTMADLFDAIDIELEVLHAQCWLHPDSARRD